MLDNRRIARELTRIAKGLVSSEDVANLSVVSLISRTTPLMFETKRLNLSTNSPISSLNSVVKTVLRLPLEIPSIIFFTGLTMRPEARKRIAIKTRDRKMVTAMTLI